MAISNKPFLGIIRKSPTPDPEVSIEAQKNKIRIRLWNDIQEGIVKDAPIIWAEDICKGDDEENRINLNKHLKNIDNFQRAYCLNVDRFSRSWLGLKWLHQCFMDVQIHFVEGIPNLYDEEGNIKEDIYLFFFIQCGFANYELMRIRRRTKEGIKNLTPEEHKEKYKGRPKGAKDKKKRKTEGYGARWS